MTTCYRIGDWLIRPQHDCIERGEEVVHIQPKPMAVLERLARAGNEVVTRDELFEAVWPGQVVSDAALTQCVAELRHAFGDSGYESTIIKTVPKVGFCLIPPVEGVTVEEVSEGAESAFFGAHNRRYVALALAVLAITVSLVWWFHDDDGTPVAVSPVVYSSPSIAVLPFADMSEAGDQGYFADGLSEEVLNRLAQVPGLRVIARHSSFSFRDADLTVPEIAQKLDVSHVLEGAVRKDGGRLRISTQLVQGEDGSQLWSMVYDRTLEDTFAVQSEIATAVADLLQARLSPRVRQRISAPPTNNMEAYDAYLLGWQRLMQRNSRSLEEGLEYMQRAVQLDEKFALAWAGLAAAFMEQRELGLDENEMLAKAAKAARQALELDPDQGLAYTILGVVQARSGRPEEAERSLQKAIELNPNDGDGYFVYGLLLEQSGRWDEARSMTTTAVSLNPMQPSFRYHHAVWLRRDGWFPEALTELNTILEFEPTFVLAYDGMATIHWMALDDYVEAALGFAKAVELDPNRYITFLSYGVFYLDLGAPEHAKKMFERSKQLAPRAAGRDTEWMLGLYNNNLAAVTGQNQTPFGECEFNAPWGYHFISQLSTGQLRNEALAAGRYEDAMALYREFCPMLLTESEPAVGYGSFRAAIDLALVLQKTGDPERAALLLDRAEAFIRDKPRLGWWGGYWIADVQILALRGRRQAALDALRRAVDEGWRSMWWYYDRNDANLDSIRNEPGFRAAMDDIRTDMAAQLEEIHKLERSGQLPTISELLEHQPP